MDEKKNMNAIIITHFARVFSEGQVSWATSYLRTSDLATRRHLVLRFFSSCFSYQPLPQITLYWAEIFDWWLFEATVGKTNPPTRHPTPNQTHKTKQTPKDWMLFGGQVSCPRAWGCPRNLTLRTTPMTKKCRHDDNHVNFFTHAWSSPP